MIAEAALDALRDANPVADIAARYGASLRANGRGLVGSCPICSNRASGSATRFEVRPDGRSWVCAVCCDGGDVIALVQRLQACDFRDAVAFLGGAEEVDEKAAERGRAERAARAMLQEKERDRYREAERWRLYKLWHIARPIACTLVETYFAARALSPPATRVLRYLPDARFYHGLEPRRDDPTRTAPRCIHTGPAMLAAILRTDGSFGGLHFTYLSPDGHDKATICDPDTGEILNPRKVRGSKKAGAIPLLGPKDPARLFWGEGIETVFSVAQALPPRPDDAFWGAVDLGNLGGKATETMAHPTLKTERGRAQRVPGPVPDLDAPAAVIPDSVVDLIILGDADSDPVLTRNAVARCAVRYKRAGRTIRAAWPQLGADFNDLKRAMAAAQSVAP